nr:C-GCAxxG-C-C family protein [Maliibacterium massiliense]
MTQQQVLDEAKRCFMQENMNCAQATAYALAKAYDLDASAITRMLTCFGGGIAAERNVCGAVSGALAVLGARQGSDKGRATDAQTYAAAGAVASDFVAMFSEACGSVLCSELTFAKGDAAGQGAFQQHNGKEKVCLACVQRACALMMDLLA